MTEATAETVHYRRNGRAWRPRQHPSPARPQPMTPAAALTLACLLLEGEAATADSDVWRKEAGEAVSVLRRLRDSLAHPGGTGEAQQAGS